ncbi:SPT23 [Candida pseudojiufengensis]|uniref:SPT23 n=1 Tax=Candida pseudojiufengensis TaxID=497109 RepID=UPI0022246D4E|nr:SPT23 [Candida pseudojiufengensis]KAI5966912.1 SPT23 [Candida pseudojiufengensis]
MTFVINESVKTTHYPLNNNNNSNYNPDEDETSRFLNDDHDILDEFLDQRVYDSIGTNTPSNNNIKIKSENDENLLNSLYALTNDHTLNNDLNNGNYQQFLDLTNHNGISHNNSIINNNNNNNSNNNTDGLTQSNDNNGSPNDYLFLDIPDQNFSHIPNQSSYDTKSINNNQPITNDPSIHTPKSINSPEHINGNSTQNKNESISNNHQLSEYEFIREELGKLKFGCHRMKAVPKSVAVPDPSYLDFSNETMSKLPYQMSLSSLPNYSRVETQIKCDINLSPAPKQSLLYVPQDLISKNKFCLSEPVESLHPKLKENLLYLDAYVLTSDLKKSCNICSRCIKREQKRASRGKAAGEADDGQFTKQTGSIKNNSSSWADEKMMKKAVIFNCKEIVSFPSPNGLNNDSKSVELSARIICYCRHHKESNGFKILVVIKDNKGEVVGKQISSPIMIMDRKKNIPLTKDSLPNSVAGSSSNLHGLGESSTSSNNRKKKLSTSDSKNDQRSSHDFTNQLSPNSLDESNSEIQINTDVDSTRSLKRKKLSVDDSYNTSSNPMYNGSINGYSPMSNSDTNTSTNIHMMKQPISFNPLSPLSQQHHQSIQLQPSHSQQSTNQKLPSIQRIIPAQGPIRGGIEITLLGFNFKPGLSVKFGPNLALATHCWSETTIVTYLPPASQPGQVLVSFDGDETAMLGGPQQQQIFTYTDDTDRQLIELALQIVGLKMNGKLEDAKNIAKRIVGTDNNNNNSNGRSASTSSSTSTSPNNTVHNTNQIHANEWFNSAHESLKKLTSSGLSTQIVLVRLLSLVDLPNCPIIIPNWQLTNKQGQTLLHLATLKNYNKLIKFLVIHGCKIDVQDNQGLTPLFLASMCGQRKLIELFIECKSNWNMKLKNDKYLQDYCDLNVIDIFNKLEEQHETELSEIGDESIVKKANSYDSLNSLFENSYGRHVSKMVHENVNDSKISNGKFDDNHSTTFNEGGVSSSFNETRSYSSDFADSEFESEDDYDEEEADYCDDEFSENDLIDEENVSENEDEDDNTTTELNSQTLDIPQKKTSNGIAPPSPGLWQKVKNVFNKEEESDSLPNYDDLFPFGPASQLTAKPKSTIEQQLNKTKSSTLTSTTSSSTTTSTSSSSAHTSNLNDQVKEQEDMDSGIASDSSEDMVMTYINHPRKSVENDKMLVFFWIPSLVIIIGLFLMIYVFGYNFKQIDFIKEFVRNSLGNVMVGNDRIGKVFKSATTSVTKRNGVEV